MTGGGDRSWPVHDGVYSLGDLEVERGGVIRDARIAWQTHGTLNAARDNVIVYPCSYTATHTDLAWLIGPDQILDPDQWFIVICDMFSNGCSSSAADLTDFPTLVTARDNVLAQHRLLTEVFGISVIAATYGFSMGAIQSYHWAALFPDLVERAIVVCGSARTAPHNQVFLSGLLRTLEAAPEYRGQGQFDTQPVLALRAFAHIYAGWGLSQDFYRARMFETELGAPDLESYLRTGWEDFFTTKPAANLYAQARTWYAADISDNPTYCGDLPAALAAIRARVLLVPSETDLYFRVADNEAELTHLAHGELHALHGVWGHGAGNPVDNRDNFAELQGLVRGWLAH